MSTLVMSLGMIAFFAGDGHRSPAPLPAAARQQSAHAPPWCNFSPTPSRHSPISNRTQENQGEVRNDGFYRSRVGR